MPAHSNRRLPPAQEVRAIRWRGGDAQSVTDAVVNEVRISVTGGPETGSVSPASAFPASPHDPTVVVQGALFRRAGWRPGQYTLSVRDGHPWTFAASDGPKRAFAFIPAGDLPGEIGAPALSARALIDAAGALQEISDLRQGTGGVHVAALFFGAKIIAWAHDVSRHTLVDRLIGATVARGPVPWPATLVLSCRITLSIVERCRVFSAPVFVSVSAVTAQAIEAARHFGITLVGFARQERVNCYTHPGRIV